MTEQPPPEGMDRLPPQAIDVEKAVLGACLLDKRGISQAGEVIKSPDDFYQRAHGRIWMVLVDLFDDDEAIDQLTVSEELKRRGQLDEIGGVVYLAELAGGVATSANVSHHTAIVTEKALARSIIELGTDMQRMAYAGDDPEKVLTHASEALYRMRDKRQSSGGAVHLEVYLAEALEQFDKAAANPDTLTGVTTGLTDLDDLTAGWQASDLILLAARPSVGKTSAGLGFARAAAESGVVVLVQELEMPGVQVGQRMLASGSGVNLHQIRTGRTDDPLRAVELNAAANRDSKLPIYIDDTGGLSISELRTRARREKSRLGIGLVIIDYIQLVDPDTVSESTEREVSNISRGLQRMARELGIPVIALSQLSRASMARKDKRPELSDLRGSGCLSGDTRIYRPNTGQWVPISKAGATDVAALSDSKINAATGSRAFYSGHRKVWRLTTGSGRSIKATACHKFLSGGGWRCLSDLRTGDVIATPSSLPNPEVSPTMSNDELILLAHLIGDGCTLPRNTIHYTSNLDDADLSETVVCAAVGVFGRSIRPRVQRGHNCIQTYLPATRTPSRGCRHPMVLWLEDLGAYGLRAHEKVIPERVHSQPLSAVRMFLRHLWSTDGSFQVRHRKSRGTGKVVRSITPITVIYYSTSSEVLASGVHNLLLRCGIKAHVRTVPQGVHHTNFHVVVCGLEGRRRFVDLIGTTGHRRGVQLQAVKSVHEVSGEGRAYDGEVYWDTIKSIHPVGEEDVFDISVPGYENFIAEGIVVHNSLEQDADVIVFPHRPEAFGITHDSDGVSEEGVGYMIVGKQRNGPTETVKVSWDKKTATFRNAAPTYRDEERPPWLNE